MVLKPLRLYLLILVLASSSICFVNLGRISLWNNNEPRYAHTARNMLESGDWITPKYKGKLRTDQPILTYWLIAASAKLLNHGEVNEFSARFPFAIMGILGITVTFLFGRAIYNDTAGLISAFTLLFTLEYIITARRSIPDMALCFFILFTLFLFYKGYQSNKKKGLYYTLAYIPAALGFLTKGPVAVLIPGGTAFLYLAVRKDLKEIKKLRIPQGLILFLILILPWFLSVTPEFSKKFFLLHNLKHFSTGLDHQKPWYFYFHALPVSFAPAFLFFPASLWLWWKGKDKPNSPLLLPLIWFFFTLLFFSMAAAKRVVYLLPTAPALALITGVVVTRFFQREPDKVFNTLVQLGLGLSTLGLALAPLLPFFFKLHPGKWIPALAILPPSLFALHLLGRPRARTGIILSLGLLFFTAYGLYFLRFQPQYDRQYRSAKPLASKIKSIVDGAPLYRMGSFDAALEFYLERPYLPKVSRPKDIERAFSETSEGFFIITREKYWNRIKKTWKSRLRVALESSNRRKRFVLLESSTKKTSP